MKPDILQQVRQLLSEAETEQEIDLIGAAIEEAKGKVRPTEEGRGFWAGKTACWEMFSCPPEVRKECPATQHTALPCWEMEGTYCKLSDYGQSGAATQICESCRVYRKYGYPEPIQIRLFGQGMGTVPAPVEQAEETPVAEPEALPGMLGIGAKVRIVASAERPDLVGAQGEVVQMQTQEHEEYCVRPVWVKLGGKTIGFWEHEIEVLVGVEPPAAPRTEPATPRERQAGTIGIGGMVKVRECMERPELAGAVGLVVQIQTQQYERYCARPVWVRIASGLGEGRTYGFWERELEPVAGTAPVRERTLQPAAQASVIRIGASVRILECTERPELVGCHGQIVQMQTQEHEEYCVRPLWVKIASGMGAGKTYGFWQHEVQAA